MPTTTTTDTIKNNKWAASLGTILAVGAVIFAATTGHKGKFWWFIGGGLIGGSVGKLIDGNPDQKTTTTTTP